MNYTNYDKSGKEPTSDKAADTIDENETTDKSDDLFEISVTLNTNTPTPTGEDGSDVGTEAATPEHPGSRPWASDPAADDVPAADAGSTAIQDDIQKALEELKSIDNRVEQLNTHFEGKIKYDEHKNRIINDLHAELQAFRDGIIKKHSISLMMDIIKIIDDTRKFKSHYERTEYTENAVESLLDFMDQIILDLEELFILQGISTFTCPGDTIDPARQRIVKKIETNSHEKNRLLAESIRPGYEWEGKVIRPEIVSMYVYTDKTDDKAGTS